MSRSSGASSIAVQNASSGSWLNSSVLGTSKRAATDLLMSSFDSGPTDQAPGFAGALAAAENILGNGGERVRVILDSRQKYTLSGNVVAGANGQWAQVPLPFSQAITGSIQLVGQPRSNDYSYIGMGGQSGTVIESTLNAAPAYQASRGIASIFGGPASFCSAHSGYTAFSMIRFALQDITIRSPSPVIAGIDSGWITGFGWDGLLQFDTDQMANFPGAFIFDFSQITVCTAPQAVALILPFSNDWYGSLGDTISVSGWCHGVMLGEFADIKRMFAFALPGAVLGVDGSKQISRIGLLTDWDNAYGIATFSPNTGSTPGSPGAVALASGYTGLTNSTPVSIGNWNIQEASGAAPAALARVWDVMDANGTFQIVDADYISTIAGGAFQAPKIKGAGGSAVGYSLGTRIRRRDTVAATLNQAAPASDAAFRNPYSRDALVHVYSQGATVTAVKVDTVQVFNNSDFLVPSQGVVAVTYTGGPPVYQWQCL